MTSSFILENVTANELLSSPTAFQTIEITIADIIDVSPTKVNVTGVSSVSSSAFVFKMAMSSSTITFTVDVTAEGSVVALEVYVNQLTEELTFSVQSGEFATILKEYALIYNASVLLQAVVVNTTFDAVLVVTSVSSAAPSFEPTPMPTESSLSALELAGIIIGAFIGGGLLVYGAIYFRMRNVLRPKVYPRAVKISPNAVHYEEEKTSAKDLDSMWGTMQPADMGGNRSKIERSRMFVDHL
jgi:hypothetical protein